MVASIECPAPDMLRRLVEHGGTAAEVEGLAQHLEQCEPCGQAVESLLGNSPMVAALCGSMADLPEEKAVQELKERLRRLRPAANVGLFREETVYPSSSRPTQS